MNDKQSAEPTPNNQPSGRIPMSALRILLIDDDAAVRETQRRLLENDGNITVVGEASSGEEALEFLATTTVDFVTTDLLLPGITSIETILQIKTRFPAIKIIVLSAYGGDLMERSLQAGANGYVLKPYASNALVERILSIAKS
jgi:DNA-binding NarL/FixJ family response regulator